MADMRTAMAHTHTVMTTTAINMGSAITTITDARATAAD